MEAGESAAEACEREVFEETGLSVRVTHLVGVYSDPDQLVIYPDGNKVHIVVLNFEAEIHAGEPRLSDETTDFGFFSLMPNKIFSASSNWSSSNKVADKLFNASKLSGLIFKASLQSAMAFSILFTW